MRLVLVLMLLLACCIGVGQESPASANESTNASMRAVRSSLAQAKSLHGKLVSAVTEGTSLETGLSNDIVESYPMELTKGKTFTAGGNKPVVGITGGKRGSKEAVLSYREAIARSEDVLKQLGLRVKVSIHATSGSCNIRYRPVVGGSELDAGQTDLAADLDPRWYVFSCDCKSPPVLKQVDCTQDTKIVFTCR